VLIVDDHPVTSLGIAAMIEKEPDLVVCGKAQDANSALAAVEKLSPDLAVVDVFLHSCGGLNLIKDIKTRRPELAVLVFSIHDESFYAERALRAGARGYISKRESPDQFIKAVREVLNGGIYDLRDTAKVRHGSQRLGQVQPERPDGPRIPGLPVHRRRPADAPDRRKAAREREDHRDPQGAYQEKARPGQRWKAREVRHPVGADGKRRMTAVAKKHLAALKFARAMPIQ